MPSAELLRGDAPDPAREPGFVEDRLGEVRPGAVAGGGEVPDPEGGAAVDERARRLGQVAHVGRAAPLVGDDGDLVALRAEPEHRAHEVVPRLAEEPGRADDPRARPRRASPASFERPYAESGDGASVSRYGSRFVPSKT